MFRNSGPSGWRAISRRVDLERRVGQVDDPVGLLALGLVGGEDPAPAVEVDVAGLDGENLLGPAAGLPADDQQVPERLVLDSAEDPGVLPGRDDHVPPAGPGLLDVADGAGLDQPHLRRPVERPLDGRDRAPLAAAPAGLGVDPLLDVDRLQSLDGKVAGYRAGERLEVVAVPVVGPRGAVLLAPVEERIEDRDHGVAG